MKKYLIAYVNSDLEDMITHYVESWRDSRPCYSETTIFRDQALELDWDEALAKVAQMISSWKNQFTYTRYWFCIVPADIAPDPSEY